MSRDHLIGCSSALCLLLLFLATGCKTKQSGTTAEQEGRTSQTTQTTFGTGAQQVLPIGMADPFGRPGSLGGKALDRGYKALRAKKYDDAAAAFGEVATTAPDLTSARFQRARALVLAGKFPEARKELEEILSRDFVAYAGRVDRPKEWKALRDSPEWPAYQQAEARYRSAYAAGLDKGFVLTARSRPAKNVADKDGTKLDLNQEVYHFDPATSRYRRLTATDGHVFAAMRSPDGKMLAFVSATRLRKSDQGDLFVDPQGGYLDLTTLDTVGPFKIAGTFYEVSIGFGPGNLPAWQTETTPGADGGTYTVDTAHTGMTKTSVQIQGERTWAQTAQVWNSGKGSPEGISVAADHKSFNLAGGAVVTSARELADSSLDWSPSHKRITYAGKLDACKILNEGDKSKNELFVYDVDKKSGQRIDSGISKFETLWLDDNLLVYENGIGDKGTVNLYDLSSHKKTTLSPHYGAGLYGIPTLACQQATPAETGEGDMPDEEPTEEGE